MAAVIQIKRGSASQWASSNFVLAAGEIGFETDTRKFKVGDGSTSWNSLNYMTVDFSSVALTGIPTAPTADSGNSTTQIATTAFVSTAISNLVDTAPGTLDTLNELAAALGDDANFATTVTNSLATKAPLNLTINPQTGTTYTFALSDSGKLVTASNSSAQTYSIPTNSTAFPIGTQINIIQIGSGQVTINAVTSGTTTVSSTGATSSAPKLRAQFSSATLLKAAEEIWYVVGDIE